MRAILLSICLFSLVVQSTAQCPNIVWEDHFDGNTVDLNHWNIQLGDGCDLNLCGWGNNELQYYQAENIEVGDGTLKIIAKKEQVAGRFYTSARINTKGKGDWTYGRFEARIKLPSGKGIWPAFWMLSSNEPYGSWPQSGEIDIMELIGSEPATAHGTIHYGQLPPNNRSSTSSYTLNEGIFNDGFHVFAIEWDVNIIRWYVDDYLYATQTSSLLGGSKWPFDQDFHFLLNLAVGGNWPGAPDAQTQFPQIMEVDYVRVLDGFLPSISGDRIVENQAKEVEYKINNLPDSAEITWYIPEDGTLVEGQNSNKIVVDWNDIGGEIRAIVGTACTTDTLLLQVTVEPSFERQLILENFDDPANIEFNFSTGTLSDNFANPSPNDLNPTSLCGKYLRNSSELFDVLIYDITILDDASPYLNGDKKFYLDVLTDAPVGTQILLQLENSTRSEPNNYPIGRNSRFEARTSVQGEWERLPFTLLDQPDINTANTSIDQLIFLFAPNSSLASTIYFDNFDSYAPAEIVTTSIPDWKMINIYPNPAMDRLVVLNGTDEPIKELEIYQINGKRQQLMRLHVPPNSEEKINISELQTGLYLLVMRFANGEKGIRRFFKN